MPGEVPCLRKTQDLQGMFGHIGNAHQVRVQRELRAAATATVKWELTDGKVVIDLGEALGSGSRHCQRDFLESCIMLI